MIKLVVNSLQRDLNLLIKFWSSLLFIFRQLLIIHDFKIVWSNLRVIRRSIIHVDFCKHARLIVLRLRLPLECHVRAKSFLKLHATVLSWVYRILVMTTNRAKLSIVIKCSLVRFVQHVDVLSTQRIGPQVSPHLMTIRHVVVGVVLLESFYLLMLVTSDLCRR